MSWNIGFSRKFVSKLQTEESVKQKVATKMFANNSKVSVCK